MAAADLMIERVFIKIHRFPATPGRGGIGAEHLRKLPDRLSLTRSSYLHPAAVLLFIPEQD